MNIKESDIQLSEAAERLQRAISGTVRTDRISRLLYSTDASIYQVEPFGVIFPKALDDLHAIVEICNEYKTPIVPRGSGSSLAGQAIGRGWVIDCARYLNRLIHLDIEAQTAIVEPGMILNELNKRIDSLGLIFGPDPASAERASMGGCISNNAAGAHSISYGMTADHLMSAEVVLSDGSIVDLDEISIENAAQIAANDRSRKGDLYRSALFVREHQSDLIKKNWPKTWRRASGYNINYLLPWSPSQPLRWNDGNLDRSSYPPVNRGSINLAALIAGAEGTLGVIRKATVRLVRKPKHTILVVMAFPEVGSACDRVPEILELGASAVELIPPRLIQMARSVPAYAPLTAILSPLLVGRDYPPSLLVVEFSGNSPAYLKEKAERLMGDQTALLAETSDQQDGIWRVRKVGLGLFMSRPGDDKPWSFIEDLAVPVERLGEFVREIERLLANYGVEAENYGHASAGCLHIRPIINLKSITGLKLLREIASEAVELTLRLGGAVSGEHGDGMARSEWNERMFGAEIVETFRSIKKAADPDGLLNPGRIVSLNGTAPLAKMDQSLRFGSEYSTHVWSTVMSFERQDGLSGAIEQCNGAGVCRKADGLMCPSFQATKEELYSTRGRANLLRAFISGKLPGGDESEKAVFDTLDLCLACKGCKSECPSAVDMAKLKYEFLEYFYRKRLRRVRDYLFGHIGWIARFGQPFSFIVNPILSNRFIRDLAQKTVGLSQERNLPKLTSRRLKSRYRKICAAKSYQTVASEHGLEAEKVLFLSDPFTEYFEPEIGLAALAVLEKVGCQVALIPTVGAGRTLISKGFLHSARKHARKLVQYIYTADPEGKCMIVGVEPSELVALRDEYLDLLPNDSRVQSIAERSYGIEEFLIRPREREGKDGERQSPKEIMRIANSTKQKNSSHYIFIKKQILLHGHCYQKSSPPRSDGRPIGVGACEELLSYAGYSVEVIDSGCCGMAGSFGYESEHYELSMRVGSEKLFQKINQSDENTLIAASGTSCRSQIYDGTGRKAYHPIELVWSALERG